MSVPNVFPVRQPEPAEPALHPKPPPSLSLVPVSPWHCTRFDHTLHAPPNPSFPAGCAVIVTQDWAVVSNKRFSDYSAAFCDIRLLRLRAVVFTTFCSQSLYSWMVSVWSSQRAVPSIRFWSSASVMSLVTVVHAVTRAVYSDCSTCCDAQCTVTVVHAVTRTVSSDCSTCCDTHCTVILVHAVTRAVYSDCSTCCDRRSVQWL